MKITSNHTEEKQDVVLWQALKTGCSTALSEIARIHYANLLRYGLALGFDREGVKDAIQNMFVYIWEHHETLSDVDNTKAYLLFGLRNRLLREQKQTKRELTFWQRLCAEKKTQQSSDMDLVDLENDFENHQNIRQTLAQLPPREREVIQLRFYEGLDNEAIATIMGITKQGVANLLVRTLKSFRAVWVEVVASVLLIFMNL